METGIGTSTLRSLGRRATLPQVAALVAAAEAAGVRWIDTADTYGAGSAERALGLAVRTAGVSPASFRVVTKGGYRFPDLPGPLRALNQPAKRLARRLGPEQRFDEQHLRAACAASLRRLAPLRIHAYCLHNPTREVLAEGTALRTLRSLRDAGSFTAVGVSIDDHALAPLVATLDGVDLVELPADAFLALDEATAEAFRRRGTELVVNRVGLLPGGIDGGLRALAAHASPPAAAIVGTRDPRHLRSNAAATGAAQ